MRNSEIADNKACECCAIEMGEVDSREDDREAVDIDGLLEAGARGATVGGDPDSRGRWPLSAYEGRRRIRVLDRR